jgi:hypothetical protein
MELFLTVLAASLENRFSGTPFMPVRVACSCGQALNVPDHLAGKVVKCPKCQKGIRVPGEAKPAPAKAAGPAAKTPAAKTPAAKPAASPGGNDALAGLFDAAGLTQRQGTFCPACDKPLTPGTAICVNCGFHLEQGTKIEGFQVESKEFGNRRLVEAAEMMKREVETEKRMLSAGMPWWMMLGILSGIVVMIAAVVIRMDATTSGSESSIPLFRRIQVAGLLPVLVAALGFGAMLIANFAQLAVLVTAFKESVKQGLLCMFVPFYIVYYMFSRIQTKKLVNTVVILWVTAILAGIAFAYALPKI